MAILKPQKAEKLCDWLRRNRTRLAGSGLTYRKVAEKATRDLGFLVKDYHINYRIHEVMNGVPPVIPITLAKPVQCPSCGQWRTYDN